MGGTYKVAVMDEENNENRLVRLVSGLWPIYGEGPFGALSPIAEVSVAVITRAERRAACSCALERIESQLSPVAEAATPAAKEID